MNQRLTWLNCRTWVASERTGNDTSIEGRQWAAGAGPGSAVRDDMTGRTEQGQRAAAGTIEQGNRQVSDEARSRSENYRSTVRAGGIRSNHGGNPAVWDTVGANASAPELGAEPKAGGKPAR
jgi:conjugal transfer mating pair stabilization protein TraG